MWIRTQEKKELVDVNYIRVYKENIRGFNVANNILLGVYSTEEKALKVMDMLEKEIHLDACQTRVFQMPQDSEVE